MRRHNTRVVDFDKGSYVDPSCIDKVTLWMLRAILKLGGYKAFIDGSFVDEETCYFLDLGKYGEMDRNEYTRKEILDILKIKLASLEAKEKTLPSHPLLSKNIAKLDAIMKLSSAEKKVLEFVVFLNQYDILNQVMGYLGRELNSAQAKRALQVILNLSKEEIEAVFLIDAKFTKSAIITMNKNYNHDLKNKFESLNNQQFLDVLFSQDEDIELMLRDIIKPLERSNLALKNYKYVQKDIDILLPYLKSALASKQRGVNILFYGVAGTGKTELAKVVAAKLKAFIFEVSYVDAYDSAIDGRERLKAYKSAQAILSNKKTLLMYDEAEDIFESSSGFFGPPQRQRDKAWINRVLETNIVPTIWITNNIDAIDNAILRRFDITMELPIPPKETRQEILKNYTHKMLDLHTLQELAKHEHIAPAVVASAAKVASKLSVPDKNVMFEHLLNNTLKAQGYGTISAVKEDVTKDIYNPNFINTTHDLNALASGLLQSQSARICLYGAPGTGKSAYGKYIAQTLKKKLIIKKASDLLGMYVGETEKKIARAFNEAKEEGAVLVFDEVDSFLSDRDNALRSWEISHVNEMLVQMENFDGIVIATTNLMNNLDKASLRRFDLKLEFGYLKTEQAKALFFEYAKHFGLKSVFTKIESQLASLKTLTPGDFAAIMRQSKFQPIVSVEDFLQRVINEVSIKKVSHTNTMGFLR